MMHPTTAEARALAALECRPGVPLLPQTELKHHLAAISTWRHADKRLRKQFSFPDYYHTIAFVNALAWMANQQDHHPDLSVHYAHVVVDWSTHDAAGTTRSSSTTVALRFASFAAARKRSRAATGWKSRHRQAAKA